MMLISLPNNTLVSSILYNSIDAHIFQPSSFYLGQYVSLTGKQAEIKSDFLLISVIFIVISISYRKM